MNNSLKIKEQFHIFKRNKRKNREVFMRKVKINIILILVISIIGLCQDSDWKRGKIIPIPPIEIKNPIKLISEDSKIEINNNIVKVTKKQTYKNISHRQMEGIYIFPLPNDALINEFSLFINNEPIRAEIVNSDEAKKIYEEIVRKLKDPAILEVIGTNLYKARIFPFAPFSERTLEIKYTQELKSSANTYRFIFPFSYDKNNRDFRNTLEIELSSLLPITNIYSPTHEILIEKVNSIYKIKVDFNKSGSSSDFLLYYTISDKSINGMSIVYDDKKEDPYFMIGITPNVELKKSNVKKNIIFTLDVSGSMMGEKIKQAKAALKYCLNNLNKGDFYSIFTFNNDVNEIIVDKEYVGDNSDENILNEIEIIEADGGTNLNNAILTALKNSKKGLPNYLLLLTDGLPTVGVKNPDEIMTNVKHLIKDNVRIFTFGVGNDLDAFLLDKLASEYGGTSNYVRENENIEIEISSFYKSISNPILSDCKIEFSGIDVYDVYPKKLPDLFQNKTLFIFGRMKKIKSGEFVISGYAEKEKKSYSYKIDNSFIDKKNVFVSCLWAKRKIAFLLDEIRNNGEDKELINEIIKLSKKYGIITPYTSYLITDEDDKSLSFAEPIIKKKQLFDPKSGYKSISSLQKNRIINQSQKIEEMKNSTKFYNFSSIKYINGKTFILKDSFWVDTEYDDSVCKNVFEIEFSNDEYFSLIDKDPELREYLSISNKLKIFYKSKCYIIK